MKPFYITTPIYYVNDKPHIGHAYTTILADVLARHYRNIGRDVFLLTGLDEHGQKVQQAAESRNINPKQHCDEMAPRFLKLWDKLHISYDDFIRTTEKRHTDIVKYFLQKVYDKGDIYEDSYEGLYSVSEERFITEKEAESGDFRDIKELKEKNYFFKMSKYQNKLIKHIEENPSFIQPKFRRNEVLGFLRSPLEDLCISRPKSRLSWGIEMPFDSNYVTYVWFDALINYVSAIGLNSDEKKYKTFWPVNYHLIGKDILTTHSVYWPTMLMSAGIKLPKSIFAHGWWLSDQSKMSKSLGNVIDPLKLIETYGVDPVRFYLMKEMVLGQDSNFSLDSFVKCYNSDLANDFGNLLSRVTNLINKFYDRKIPNGEDNSEAGKAVRKSAREMVACVLNLIDEMKINDAINHTFKFIREVNKYLEITAPWKLLKKDIDSAGKILYTAAESLRITALILSPIMPNRAQTVFDIFHIDSNEIEWGGLIAGTKIEVHKPLFPRIETNS
ncbi:MAG: methionine--tRNA ligase [Candidatus Neomarinimicrobiota bacterium]|nr:methionine--tRNA ligase [Candidatus Neomarinimicrobiota bacterium]|tara:strand:- start:790 stop:2289 length:1500 start_codon:yes stop_codon:yes gene_type:complete